AEKRRGLGVGVALGDGEREVRAGNRVLGISAVQLVSGEAWPVAEIFAPGETVGTTATHSSKPGDADAIALGPAGNSLAHGIDRPDDLVTGNQAGLRRREIAPDDMQ